jgi:deoxyribodipyrimidine photolyase-like uncharacterized protein
VTIGILRRCWKSVQKIHWFSTLRTRILGCLAFAAQHTDLTRQQTMLLIGHCCRRSARTFQFVADRISARVKILKHSKLLHHLKVTYLKLGLLMARAPAAYAATKNKFAAAKGYAARIAGGK